MDQNAWGFLKKSLKNLWNPWGVRGELFYKSFRIPATATCYSDKNTVKIRSGHKWQISCLNFVRSAVGSRILENCKQISKQFKAIWFLLSEFFKHCDKNSDSCRILVFLISLKNCVQASKFRYICHISSYSFSVLEQFPPLNSFCS